jgi:hypothetical protein
VVVDSKKMSDGVSTALKACEAAGYKTVKFTGPVLQGGGDQSEYKHYKAAEKNPAKLLKEIEDSLRRW